MAKGPGLLTQPGPAEPACLLDPQPQGPRSAGGGQVLGKWSGFPCRKQSQRFGLALPVGSGQPGTDFLVSTPGSRPPHLTSPSGPSPPGCCAPLHMPQRSHPPTCAHLGPQNETLPDKERVCRALSTHCVHFLHILYLLFILRQSLVAACFCELNTPKLRGGLPRSPWGPAACLRRAPPAAFSALCFGFPAHHQWLRIQ